MILSLTRPEILTHQFSTNLFGPLNLTRALLPHFRSKRSGIFVFIGSICGWRGDPTIAAYCASKFALEGEFDYRRFFLAQYPHFIQASHDLRISR